MIKFWKNVLTFKYRLSQYDQEKSQRKYTINVIQSQAYLTPYNEVNGLL